MDKRDGRLPNLKVRCEHWVGSVETSSFIRYLMEMKEKYYRILTSRDLFVGRVDAGWEAARESGFLVGIGRMGSIFVRPARRTLPGGYILPFDHHTSQHLDANTDKRPNLYLCRNVTVKMQSFWDRHGYQWTDDKKKPWRAMRIDRTDSKNRSKRVWRRIFCFRSDESDWCMRSTNGRVPMIHWRRLAWYNYQTLCSVIFLRLRPVVWSF